MLQNTLKEASKKIAAISLIFSLASCASVSNDTPSIENTQNLINMQERFPCRDIIAQNGAIASTYIPKCDEFRTERARLETAMDIFTDKRDAYPLAIEFYKKWSEDPNFGPTMAALFQQIGIIGKEEALESFLTNYSQIECGFNQSGQMACGPVGLKPAGPT